MSFIYCSAVFLITFLPSWVIGTRFVGFGEWVGGGGGPSAQFQDVYAAEDAKGIHWRRCLRDWVRVAILNVYQRIVLTQALEWKVYSILLVKKDKNIKIPNVFKSFFAWRCTLSKFRVPTMISTEYSSWMSEKDVRNSELRFIFLVWFTVMKEW